MKCSCQWNLSYLDIQKLQVYCFEVVPLTITGQIAKLHMYFAVHSNDKLQEVFPIAMPCQNFPAKDWRFFFFLHTTKFTESVSEFTTNLLILTLLYGDDCAWYRTLLGGEDGAWC